MPVIIASFVLLIISCNGTGSEKPVLFVPKRVVDMGMVSMDRSYLVSYSLINKGASDLLIDTLTSSCGCSEPVVDKKKISPLDSASLQVTFKPNGYGRFSKSIVIKSNIDSVFFVLYLKGEVAKNN